MLKVYQGLLSIRTVSLIALLFIRAVSDTFLYIKNTLFTLLTRLKTSIAVLPALASFNFYSLKKKYPGIQNKSHKCKKFKLDIPVYF